MYWNAGSHCFSALRLRLWLLLLLVLIVSGQEGSCALFSRIPSPIGYEYGEEIPITVNSLTSSRGLLPYDFYSVKTCTPDAERMKDEKVKENLGEILLGNRIRPSVYSVTVGRNQTCHFLCAVTYTRSDIYWLRSIIHQKYRAHMFLAGLPVVENYSPGATLRRPRLGYALGKSYGPRPSADTIIHNHLNFIIEYATTDSQSYIITRFYVSPSSHQTATGCPVGNGQETAVAADDEQTVAYSYAVTWVETTSENIFVTRWDIYALTGRNASKRSHWVAVLNSLLLLSFFGIIVLVVLARTVRRDLLRYADEQVTDELQSESGWKLVRGDVFRAPPKPMLLCAFVATGCQTFTMVVSTVASSILGVLHPSQRGNLLTGLIVLFCVSSSVSGYVAGVMLRFFRKQSWKNGFMAATAVPLALMSVYLLVDIVNWMKHASTAVPFRTLLLFLLLWFVIPLPLLWLGLSAGFKKVIEVPAKVSSIPRIIPAKAVRNRYLYVIGCGLIPFTAAFVEVVYTLGSFWKGEPFRFLGYLACIAFIIIIICAELAVVVTYVMLCEEDYQWWWCSFLVSGSFGLHFFLYSIVYLTMVLEIRQLISIILFLVYTLGFSFVVSLTMGAIGFLSSALFVKIIYAAIKAD